MKTILLIRHSVKEKSYMCDKNIDRQKFDEQKKLSEEGKKIAIKLSQMDILKNVDEVWASKYQRAIETAKILFNKRINISDFFDERHYGDFKPNTDIENFWIEQFKNEDLRNNNGESQKDVRTRFDNRINYILNNSHSNEIAIVSHNAAILFYLLKYCTLIKAEIPKKLTISYKNKILIKDAIMKSPSIMKLTFENDNLIDIEYIEI